MYCFVFVLPTIPRVSKPWGYSWVIYLLYKSIMNKFKRWDIVTVLREGEEPGTKEMWIEAVVDFQDGDTVYISEWWKNLNNPVRYLVPANILFKKDNWKITISLKEINALMSQVLSIQNADFNREPSIDNMKIWDVFVNDWAKYKYVWKLDWKLVWDKWWYFCVIDDEDINKLFWTQESVCQKIFGLSKDKVNII